MARASPGLRPLSSAVCGCASGRPAGLSEQVTNRQHSRLADDMQVREIHGSRLRAREVKHERTVTRQAMTRTAGMLLTSLAATTVDVVLLLVLARVRHMPAGVAAAGGCLAGGFANFFLMRQFVFRRPEEGWLKPLLLYLFSVVLCGALLSGAIVQIAVHLGAAILLAKVIAQATTMLTWNFPVTARLVFRAGGLP